MPPLTRNVPYAALTMAAGTLEFGDNGADAKSAPLRAVVRTNAILSHWFWGRTVHDLAGMFLPKPRIVVDYIHDPNQVIGYANKFDRTTERIEATGALVPYGGADRATEIITQARGGVPYEASINFAGQGLVIEEVQQGATAQVNGQTVEGPITIFRQWPLRGFAVCPYGMDQRTSSELSAQPEIPVTILTQGDSTMDQETPGAEAPQPEAVETPQPAVAELAAASVDAVPPAALAGEAPPAPPEASALAVVTEAAPPVAPGRRFLQAFGDLGGRWFAEGLSFDDARSRFAEHQATRITALEGQVAELKVRITQAARGEKPVPFQAAASEPEPDPMAERKAKRKGELTQKLGDPVLAAVAAKFESEPPVIKPAAH